MRSEDTRSHLYTSLSLSASTLRKPQSVLEQKSDSPLCRIPSSDIGMLHETRIPRLGALASHDVISSKLSLSRLRLEKRQGRNMYNCQASQFQKKPRIFSGEPILHLGPGEDGASSRLMTPELDLGTDVPAMSSPRSFARVGCARNIGWSVDSVTVRLQIMLSQRQKMRPPSEVPARSKTGYKRSRSLARCKSVWCGAGLCMAMAFVLAVALFLGLFLGRPHKGFAATGLEKGEVQVYEYEVVAEFPHDPNAFTQGLLYYKDDILYESTGLNGQSSVRRVDLSSGEVRQLKRLGSQYFGEGLTLWNDRLLQVLWLTTQGFIYNRENLSQVGTFTQPMRDGWGLTGDATQLIGSDGTSTLYFINPDTFAEIRNITVTDGGRKVTFLNELEYIGDEIWANVWQKECIVRICPKDGRVKAWILLTGLRDSIYKGGYKGRQLDVLNGIAWDSKQERLFVTGKLWPKLFQIKLRSPSAGSNITVESARATCIISNQR